MFGGWEGEATGRRLNSFHVTLGPFEGFSLLVQRPIGPEPDPGSELRPPTFAPATISYPTMEYRTVRP